MENRLKRYFATSRKLDKFEDEKMANIEKDYALYYGDELVFVGTMKEMAEFTNKRIETLYTYGNKRYKDRNTYLLIKIEEDEEC